MTLTRLCSYVVTRRLEERRARVQAAPLHLRPASVRRGRGARMLVDARVRVTVDVYSGHGSSSGSIGPRRCLQASRGRSDRRLHRHARQSYGPSGHGGLGIVGKLGRPGTGNVGGNAGNPTTGTRAPGIAGASGMPGMPGKPGIGIPSPGSATGGTRAPGMSWVLGMPGSGGGPGMGKDGGNPGKATGGVANPQLMPGRPSAWWPCGRSGRR